MAEKIHLKILVPEGIKYEEDVSQVILPGEAGEFSVVKKHISMITPLKIGQIEIVSGEESRKLMAAAGGISRVEPEYITLILRAAEFEDEIDVNRAEAAKKRAEKRLNSDKKEIDYNRAERALRRAVNRLNVAK
ncbi:MAG: ATP synthase F1 subunit epsilon [Candidatus Mcinerneyibacterium aminivorans]|uniref:ATP synthase epsilon chain n=1 Tax=Candidatus Mcinerneyibacterium aminivorans TaxID=2703815 RepID=A0A5D0MLS2_9BACT|nr:MAG: ATP synthase F1 subunit epsilon [Candidatus Mcinerneyibacterium aminivorans]